jgi:hypothetical protein
MFNLFKRNPIREAAKEVKVLLQIPTELITVTARSFSDACSVLVRANLKGRFDEEALFAEICAYHVTTVITTMNRVAGVLGGSSSVAFEEAFDRSAKFLVKTVPEILDDARSRGIADTELMKVLTADKTLHVAAVYYIGMHEVSDDDVLDFGRKYNPKLLSLNRDDRANSVFAYVIRAVRIAHVENLPTVEARTAAVGLLNDTLVKAVLDLEAKVEKLTPKGQTAA